ncbi:MAG TPA: prolyl oligopeptidase family serine peptidase [Ktedonobacterales bacterium]
MTHRLRLLLPFVLLLTLVSVLTIGTRPAVAAGLDTITGKLPDGAAYLIEKPTPWNGTLALYSHGYVTPGSPNPAHDVGDAGTRSWLLANGYALAGSSYSTTGWALQQAFSDQIAVLNIFDTQVGAPQRTIAWGHSLGGIITAGLVQLYPQRFSAALPMCGVVAGGVGTWNVVLDSAFAFNLLLANNSLQVVRSTNPNANLMAAEQALAVAQTTPQGRARLALAAALGDLPGWYDSASPEPAATDYATQEYNQYQWEKNVDFPFAWALRAELEYRAGGNVSWNTGVNYNVQFSHSVDQAEVQALYAQAGLSLDADLAALQAAPRISADANAVSYLNQYISFNGKISIPVLTMHTTGDGLVLNEDEQAYASVVRSNGNNNLLRETFVHRAGHCAFTPAETVTAFQTLINRLDTGQWRASTNPATMNTEAAALGPLNIAPPSFITYQPAQFLRPFTAYSVAP